MKSEQEGLTPQTAGTSGVISQPYQIGDVRKEIDSAVLAEKE